MIDMTTVGDGPGKLGRKKDFCVTVNQAAKNRHMVPRTHITDRTNTQPDKA